VSSYVCALCSSLSTGSFWCMYVTSHCNLPTTPSKCHLNGNQIHQSIHVYCYRFEQSVAAVSCVQLFLSGVVKDGLLSMSYLLLTVCRCDAFWCHPVQLLGVQWCPQSVVPRIFTSLLVKVLDILSIYGLLVKNPVEQKKI